MNRIFSKIWLALVIFIILVGGGIFAYWTIFGGEKVEVKNLVQQFYRAIEEQNGDLAMSYFTPPVTPAEKESYDWLIAADFPEDQRFFRGFLRVKIANPATESIKKLDKGNFRVNLTDDFQSWSNTDPVGYGPVVKRDMVIIAAKMNNKWLIDEWNYPAYKYTVNKYSGFGQEEIISPDETADWQTYRNEKEGFEIKYPSFLEGGELGCGISEIEDTIFIGPISLIFFDIQSLTLDEWINREIAQAEEDTKEIQEGFKQAGYGNWQEFGTKLLSREEIFVDGERAVKLSYQFIGAGFDLPITISVKKGDRIYDFRTNDVNLVQEECAAKFGKKPSEVMELMLSTFRFVEPAEKEGPYIKVLSPNGGEQWVAGNTYDIVWKSSGIERVAISIASGGKDLGLIVFGINAKSGKYSWQIPDEYITNSYWEVSEVDSMRIKVCDNDNPNPVCDENDNYFSIIQK